MTLDPVSVTTRLRTADGDEPALATRRFEMIERIDHPYEVTLELVSDDTGLDVRSLLGARASLEFDREDVASRTLRGVVTRSEYITTRNRQLFVRLVVEPSLALLRYSTRRRIFADQTLLEVLETVAGPVFSAHGGAWDASRLRATPQPRDYVVQYDETDLEFVVRLLSESGLCLLHGASEETGETVFVLADHNDALPNLIAGPALQSDSTPWVVPFVPEAEEEADEPSVQYLGRWDGLHAKGVRLAARDWKTPKATRFSTSIELGEDRGHEGHVWRYHPRRLDEGKESAGPHHNETEAWAVRLLEEQRAGSVEITGASNVTDFAAGATFELQGHPHLDLDQRYAVLSVVHQADFPEVELAADNALPTYSNRFVVMPLDAGPVRPPLRPKARATGIESATVVGPEGEEVHTDALGRVRVRFHWDEPASQTCWLRVMTSWAGPGYGASFIPRVGMEVVVGFLGGDPDRPVVTGCLYTGTNVPPGALPETKTCTTLRTQSTPGGEGFNELRFEDAAGNEEVYLHAQRVQRTVVGASQSTRVGTSRTLNVGKDSTRTIGGSETVQVGTPEGEDKGHLTVSVTGTETRTIEEDHLLDCRSAHWSTGEQVAVNAPMSMWLSAGPKEDSSLEARPGGSSLVELLPKSITIEAPESIVLKVGDSKLELNQRGVFLEGPTVTADAEDQLWLTTDAGRVGLTQGAAGIYGGKKSESSIELTADVLHSKAKGMAFTDAESVKLMAADTAKVVSRETTLVGREKATVHSEGSAGVTGTTVDVHAEGETNVKGKPIRLN